MENYAQDITHSSEPTEDRFTKAVEEYTASIPSSGYLAVAVAAMGASLLLQSVGKQVGQFSCAMGPYMADHRTV